MKTLIIFLFSISLFAQEATIVGKGSGSYLYDCVTGTDLMVNGDLYLYGHYTKTLNDTGAYSFKRYIVWKYDAGTYDSVSADNVLFMAGTWAVRINDPTLDATGTYYASILYKTQRGRGVWIYDRGGDSTSTTPVTIVPPDTVPVQFTFHDSTGAEHSTLVESGGITLTGIDSCWAYAGGASFKVNADAWRTAGIKVFDDDVLYLRATSSSVCTTVVNTTLTVGGVSDIFSITTKLDNTPSAFTFTDVTGAETSTLYTSNQFTLAGINCNAAISVNGGQYQIDATAWRSSSTTVANGSLVRVRNTSSANHNTSVTSILTIGGVQDTYTVTTRPDSTPSQFTFTDVTNAHLDSLHTSNGVALTSLDSCNASAGLDTFKVGIYGAWFVGMKKVYGNDTIYLKNVSSGSYSTAESMTFSAGGTTDTWTITTMQDPSYTAWYCNGALTTSTNTGTSWANAWESFADINWASLEPGDRLYISGGASATVYYETLTPEYQGTQESDRIYILPGKYSPSPSGHSGRVVIHGGWGTTYGNGLRESSIYTTDGCAWVTIKGFELTGATKGVMHNGYTVDGMVYDSLNIYDFYNQAGLEIKGGDSTVIRNCRIVTFEINDTSDQTDGIYADETSRIYVEHCYIRNRNQGPTAHNDAIQGQNSDGWVIANNVIITDSVNSTQGGGVPWLLGSTNFGDDNPVILYNNFLYMGGAWYCTASPGWAAWNRFYGSSTSEFSPTYILHNTIVTNGPAMGNIVHEYTSTVEINNIFASWCQSAYRTSTYPSGSGCRGWASYAVYDVAYIMNNNWNIDPPIDSVRNNLFWKEDSTQSGLFAGTMTDSGNEVFSISSGWSAWISHGGTGLNRDPLFVNNIGKEPEQGDIRGEIKVNSPAINAGENAEWYINYFIDTYHLENYLEWSDINGVARDGTPDIGAYQYGGE